MAHNVNDKGGKMSDQVLRVGFLGAGNVNFGDNTPWDHASRLETFQGVKVVGIADIDTEKAGAVLKSRQSNKKNAAMYKDCVVYKSLTEMLREAKLDVAIIGTPPCFRGNLKPGEDAELECLLAGVHVFTEKPLSVTPLSDFNPYVDAIRQAQAKTGTLISVGYMFRYHDAVRKMKELIGANGGHVMSINARYYMAYERCDRPFWWDVTTSGGPIIEQATHFCDIMRFLAGDVMEGTVRTICLHHSHPAGQLSRVPDKCEEGVAEENRVPRITVASWRFQDGGIGCLNHCVSLHGGRYDTSIDVLMDGLRMTLSDPYSEECYLSVRGLDSADPFKEEIFRYGESDPYKCELETFINAVKSGDGALIASTYEDAAKTYQLTWTIRNAEKHTSGGLEAQ